MTICFWRYGQPQPRQFFQIAVKGQRDCLRLADKLRALTVGSRLKIKLRKPPPVRQANGIFCRTVLEVVAYKSLVIEIDSEQVTAITVKVETDRVVLAVPLEILPEFAQIIEKSYEAQLPESACIPASISEEAVPKIEGELEVHTWGREGIRRQIDEETARAITEAYMGKDGPRFTIENIELIDGVWDFVCRYHFDDGCSMEPDHAFIRVSAWTGEIFGLALL